MRVQMGDTCPECESESVYYEQPAENEQGIIVCEDCGWNDEAGELTQSLCSERSPTSLSKERDMLITKIISWGQTGADRAGLDFAIEQGIPHGGWCPKGRKAEDGVIPECYDLQEMPTSAYPPRTEKNVIESDGTLIITKNRKATGGSGLTISLAVKHKKPWIHIALDDFESMKPAGPILAQWLAQKSIRVLNVAGSRESTCPGIHDKTVDLLKAAVGAMAGYQKISARNTKQSSLSP